MPSIPIQSACICNRFNIVKASQTSKRNAYHLVCSCWYSVASYIILHSKKGDMHKIAYLNHHMIVNVRCTLSPVISSTTQRTAALLYVLNNIETVAAPYRDHTWNDYGTRKMNHPLTTHSAAAKPCFSSWLQSPPQGYGPCIRCDLVLNLIGEVIAWWWIWFLQWGHNIE